MRTALDISKFFALVVIGMPIMLICLVIGGLLAVADILVTLASTLIFDLPSDLILGFGAGIAKSGTRFLKDFKARAQGGRP